MIAQLRAHIHLHTVVKDDLQVIKKLVRGNLIVGVKALQTLTQFFESDFLFCFTAEEQFYKCVD